MVCDGSGSVFCDAVPGTPEAQETCGNGIDDDCDGVVDNGCPGTPCGVDGDCVSTHCVNGVCCNTACAGECFTCSGTGGTCVPRPNGTPCAGGTCDGSGGCTPSG